MEPFKIQTGIRFDAELLYKISHIAKQNKRSLNAQLEFIVLEQVAEYEEKNGKIAIDKKWLNEKYRKNVLD